MTKSQTSQIYASILAALTVALFTPTTTASPLAHGEKPSFGQSLKKFFSFEKSPFRQYKAPNAHQAGMRVNDKLLAAITKGECRSRVIVDIKKQRAYLLAGDEIAIDSPISSARRGKYTPRGTFRMTQRVRSGKRSSIYGCEMPNWMRLNATPFGLHVGHLPGGPASAGCVRLPENAAKLIFAHTKRGTTVRITNSWTPTKSQIVAQKATR